jgi:hypothetical protein
VPAGLDLPEYDALGSTLRETLGRRARHLASAKRDGYVIHAPLASRQHSCCRDAPGEVRAEARSEARADERDAARVPSARYRCDEELERLSRDFAPAGGAGDLAAGCGVQSRQVREVVAVEDWNHEPLRLDAVQGRDVDKRRALCGVRHPAIMAYPA